MLKIELGYVSDVSGEKRRIFGDFRRFLAVFWADFKPTLSPVLVLPYSKPELELSLDVTKTIIDMSMKPIKC